MDPAKNPSLPQHRNPNFTPPPMTFPTLPQTNHSAPAPSGLNPHIPFRMLQTPATSQLNINMLPPGIISSSGTQTQPLQPSVIPNRPQIPPSTMASDLKPQNKRLMAPPAADGTQTFRTAEVVPAPKRTKKKSHELSKKKVAEKVAAFVPESSLFTRLLELEHRLDETLMRKKLEIQEALKNPPRAAEILRIYVYNTHSHQEKPATGQQEGNPTSVEQEEPSWTLHVVGRLVGAPEKQMNPFSSFLTKFTVQLDPSQYTDHQVVWEASSSSSSTSSFPSSGPLDGFEITRKGGKEFTAKITLELNYTPQRFQLSACLASILGVTLETRPRVISALWQYIKLKKLQSPNDPTVINCDGPLQQLFGEACFKMSTMASKLHAHLAAPPPITIQHTVRLAGPTPHMESVYDVSVDAPSGLQKDMADFLLTLEKHKDIEKLDGEIVARVERVNEQRKRREFFLGFSQSPVSFIHSLMASQQRDLRVAAGVNERDPQAERRSEFYRQPWVEEAVLRYINRRPVYSRE